MSEVFPPLSPDIPIPVDDGAAAHLLGMRLPSLSLPSTSGVLVDLASLTGRTVLFAYPRTGRPGEPPLSANWDMIPGARGCNRQACAFRDLHAAFAAVGARVLGISTQSSEYQRGDVAQMHLPFTLLSDAELRLASAARLPTLAVAGLTLLRRLTLVIEDGLVQRVFYPVFPPDRATDDVLASLRA
jgi:peroxiredoxin